MTREEVILDPERAFFGIGQGQRDPGIDLGKVRRGY